VTIPELAIKRPAFVVMVFSALAVLGIFSYTQMGSDLLPKMSWPMVLVSTPYPGAGPKEIESQVSKPIEEALASLPGLKSLRTYSNENYSFAWLEFTMSTNTDDALRDVERKISVVKASFPSDVKQPLIDKADINAAPILRIAVTSTMAGGEFYQFVKDRVAPRIEQVPGIATVDIVGGREREIIVEVDNERLQLYGIPLTAISQKLASENLDFPAGVIDQKTRRYIVRVAGSLESLDAVRDVILASPPSGPVRLRDVAEVHDSYKEEYTVGRLNSSSCIGIIVQKASDANAIQCCDKAQVALKALEREYRDRQLSFTTAQDITTFTRESLHEVRKDMGLAVLMVALVLFLFLHSARNSIIVLLSIPTSIITAISVMYFFGFTINIVTLLALTLVIGILVDDSIVVLENIHRHIQQGEEPKIAAVRGRNEIGMAAVAITLVDVAVFLPIAMLSGVVGKIFKEFGITVVAATLVSLLVSFTLTPMLASRWSRLEHHRDNSLVKRIIESLDSYQTRLNAGYRRVLSWALRHRKTVIAVSFCLFLASLSLIPLGLIGSEFLPGVDRGEFAINIDMPLGTGVEATNKATATVEDMVRTTPEVSQYYAIVGRREEAFGNAQHSYISQIQVKLKKDSARPTQKVIAGLLQNANTIPGVRAQASLIGLFGAADETPIAIEVKGDDLETLIPASQKILDAVKNTSGTRNARSSWEEGQPELRVVVDRERCAQHNVGLSDIALTLRTAFAGDISSKYREKSTEYDIRVILSPSQRNSPENVSQTRIMNQLGQRIVLGDVASVSVSKGPSQIARKDRSRVITIMSTLSGSRALGDVVKDINKNIKAITLPNGVTVFYGGDVENMQDMQSDMMKAIFFAILFMYMVMVCLYESYLYPFVIMFSVPVALVGGLLLLALTGATLNLNSMIGILMSVGLVTKNAILLVDYTNTLRARGMPLHEALMTAGPIRLRPILMTTATMVFGMMPLALAIGASADMRRGFGLVVIGSLISSTLLTLVLVPVMYTVLDGWKNKIRFLIKRKGATVTGRL
jgi:HAE1 family hydrophobic/amphiphilic exporter-1